MSAQRSLNFGEVAVGLTFVLFGIFVAWEGSHYPLGTLHRMGPGMFPVGLGIGLAGLGLASTVESMWIEAEAESASLRAFITIALGLLAWAVMVEPFGLVPATVILVVASALAHRPIKPVSVAMVAIVLCIIGDVTFIRLLGLPVTAFGR